MIYMKLPLNSAIDQAHNKAKIYCEALRKLDVARITKLAVREERMKQAVREVDKAYGDLSSAQWELNTHLKGEP